jgi:hypothetical protein
MADTTLLTWNTRVTVAQLKAWISGADRDAIATFLRDRFQERYFEPIDANSNGFLIMAVCCLVVEALESFRQGWSSSDRNGERAFGGFFARHSHVQEMSPVASQFYKHVRCGVLHQGETTGGWTLTRKSPEPLVNVQEKRLNAARLHEALRKCLDDYVEELKRAAITEEIWTNCLTKLYSVIRNCD